MRIIYLFQLKAGAPAAAAAAQAAVAGAPAAAGVSSPPFVTA